MSIDFPLHVQAMVANHRLLHRSLSAKTDTSSKIKCIMHYLAAHQRNVVERHGSCNAGSRFVRDLSLLHKLDGHLARIVHVLDNISKELAKLLSTEGVHRIPQPLEGWDGCHHPFVVNVRKIFGEEKTAELALDRGLLRC